MANLICVLLGSAANKLVDEGPRSITLELIRQLSQGIAHGGFVRISRVGGKYDAILKKCIIFVSGNQKGVASA